jgi:hypothetical protein
MAVTSHAPSPALRAGEWLVLGGLIAWLVTAASVVDIEYYDGLDTICNARWFLGQGDFFLAHRAPMMAVTLIPAEWMRTTLGLHPLDFRPAHSTMALLHAGYLIAVYAALVRYFGRTWASLVAFLAAIPSFMFLSYAPFISHDLLPGALFLWMLLLGERFRREPRLGTWLVLVSLGAVGPLIKHTYALFWVSVLGTGVVLSLAGVGPGWRAARRPLLLLVAGAVLSAAITWLSIALVAGQISYAAPFLLRPWALVRYLMTGAGGGVEFPWWVYLRNAAAYGPVAMALLIPGLLIGLWGASEQRAVALAWLLCVVVMQVLGMREVRYLAFLAPLTAFLLVPPVAFLLRRRGLATITVAALALGWL